MKVIVNQYEKALLFRKGRLERILEPGEYRIFPILRRQRTETVDMRIRSMVITGQEMMTSDKVTLRMNVLVKYRVRDPVAGEHGGALREERDALPAEGAGVAGEDPGRAGPDDRPGLGRGSPGLDPEGEVVRRRVPRKGDP